MPVVYSFRRVSTSSGRTFRSRSFWPVASGHLAEIHFPNAITWGFEAAAAGPVVAHIGSNASTRNKTGFLTMAPAWHGSQVAARLSVHGKCSVSGQGGADVLRARVV